MTEWDNLWNDYGGPSFNIGDFQRFDTWVKLVKSEGDKLQAFYDKYNAEVMFSSSDDAPLRLILVSEYDRLQDDVEGYKIRYDDLHRITVKWQNKLEAIRTIVQDELDAIYSDVFCDQCSAPCSNDPRYASLKKLKEVFGDG